MTVPVSKKSNCNLHDFAILKVTRSQHTNWVSYKTTKLHDIYQEPSDTMAALAVVAKCHGVARDVGCVVCSSASLLASELRCGMWVTVAAITSHDQPGLGQHIVTTDN